MISSGTKSALDSLYVNATAASHLWSVPPSIDHRGSCPFSKRSLAIARNRCDWIDSARTLKRRAAYNSRRVVPVVELVKSVEFLTRARSGSAMCSALVTCCHMATYLMGVHVQRINRQIVRGQVETLEHLFERQLVPVSENDDFLGVLRVSSCHRNGAPKD